MRLKDIAKINPSNITKKYKYGEIEYLDTANITEGIVDQLIHYEISDAPSRAKRIVENNDIIYSTVRPNLKHYGIIKNPCNNLIVSTAFSVIRCHKDVNPDYVYAYLTLPFITSKLASIAEGSVSTYPSIRPKDLENIEIKLYSKEIQNKISNIYFYYNSLIENNNKKIKMLEQIVEKVYKEWFVKFKFPEYEKYEFVERKPSGWIYGNDNQSKVPKRWHYGSLSEIGKFKRGKNITSEKMIEGNIPVISAGIQPSGYHNEANVFGKSLTMSASGANAGYLKYNLKDIWAADCSYYQNDSNIWFVYSSLKFINLAIKNLQVGAAQPHVYPKNINNLNIIIPEEKYIKMYQAKVSVIFEEIKILNEENTNLTKQRDLLLPRLMTGKLEIK